MICFASVRITEQPRSVKGVIGSPAMLHCKAEGLGPITYSWFRSDTKEGRPKPVYQSENEWYVIKCLAQKHWGYYVCHAENQYEYAASRRVHISAHLPTAAALTRRTKCKYCCIVPIQRVDLQLVIIQHDLCMGGVQHHAPPKAPPMNLGRSQKHRLSQYFCHSLQ